MVFVTVLYQIAQCAYTAIPMITASSHCRENFFKKVRYGTTTIYITAEVECAKSYRYRTICVAIYLHDMGVTAACGRLASHW